MSLKNFWPLGASGKLASLGISPGMPGWTPPAPAPAAAATVPLPEDDLPGSAAAAPDPGAAAQEPYAEFPYQLCIEQALDRAEKSWEHAQLTQYPWGAATEARYAMSEIATAIYYGRLMESGTCGEISQQETDAAFQERFGVSGSAFIHGKLREYALNELAKAEEESKRGLAFEALQVQMDFFAREEGMQTLEFMLNALKIDPETPRFREFLDFLSPDRTLALPLPALS